MDPALAALEISELDLTGRKDSQAVKRQEDKQPDQTSPDFAGVLSYRQHLADRDVCPPSSRSTSASSVTSARCVSGPSETSTAPTSAESTPNLEHAGIESSLGETLVTEILKPVIDDIRNGKMAEDKVNFSHQELQGLATVSQGFEELRQANPALGWQLMEEVLGRMNE